MQNQSATRAAISLDDFEAGCWSRLNNRLYWIVDKQGRVVPFKPNVTQEELAQLLGASRQRVNQELKAMEREDAIRIEPGGLVVRDREALMRIAEADN